MVIFCIDGGLPTVVRHHDFFNLARTMPGLTGSPVHELPSIYPSSTAPSHASFLTGGYPVAHGIVGNRFWETQSVAEIRRRADDPLSAFHPYERASLTAPSLLDWFAEQGVSVAAVHFPQTFSRVPQPAHDIPSCYCLYAPSHEATVSVTADGPVAGSGPVTLSYLGHELQLRVTVAREGKGISVVADGGPPVPLALEAPTRLDLDTPIGRISVAVTAERKAPGAVTLRFGTAVITMGFGGLSPSVIPFGSGPASLSVEYTANPQHTFHESPRAEWVERTALAVLDEYDPDVLLVRFNQADHAQEFLYWYATRGTPAERVLAWQQILDVYARIDACVARLAHTVGLDTEFLFFSDHGIDFVETHLSPNRALADAGLLDRMVFQGDSNCAYLYADSPLRPAERRLLTDRLSALDSTVSVLEPAALERMGLPPHSPRVGRLAIACGPHIEFQYGDQQPARQQVASASHGYVPACSSMSGFLRHFGRTPALHEPPKDITGAASLVQHIWRRTAQGE